MPPRKRLGDILQDNGLLDEQQLQKGLEMQRNSGEKLGEALVKLKIVTSEQIANALSEHLGVERVNFARRYIPSETVKLVPEEILKEFKIMPIELNGSNLTVAMVDPLNILIIDRLQEITGFSITPLIATSSEIDEAIQRTRDIGISANKVFAEFGHDEILDDKQDTEQLIGDAPGVKLANMILQQAIRQKASDIHFEPREEDLRVRFRVDGIMQDIMVVPKSLRTDVNSRIKIMSNLDITERRKPQDGRIQVALEGGEVDMRISTLPTMYGEKIVARVLNKSDQMLTIEDFGFEDSSKEKLYRILRQNQGLILVTGPTGSGKTTTLYGFLAHLNTPEKNIITVEDPVEYRLDGISQVQTNAKVGLSFSVGLRSVLRQDPDTIMVGEIRDGETAEIAIRAALTGHLVLSTLHTNSAVACIARLSDMGIEPYMLSSTITGVIAQRLVRTICSECKESVPLTDPIMIRFIQSLHVPVPDHVYQGRGCPVCNNTGYRGRAALEEVLLLNRELRQAIDQRATELEMEDIAIKSGFVSLQTNAVRKLIAGITSVAEIIRTVYSVDEEEAFL